MGREMMLLRPLLASAILALLGACNMAISETPMFADADRASLAPKDGIWLADDKDCLFEPAKPETDWPTCAGWLVVRDRGREIWVKDGKGQSERGEYLIAGGTSPIVQVKYTDQAKKDGKTFYVFFGIEPNAPGPDRRFTAAFTWEVKCGLQAESASQIAPYPGISAGCRPSSTRAIRSAALASRPAAAMAMNWRWLRPERR